MDLCRSGPHEKAGHVSSYMLEVRTEANSYSFSKHMFEPLKTLQILDPLSKSIPGL